MTPRAARIAAGVSVETAARAIRVRPSTLGRYETGGNWPTRDFRELETLCRLYGCQLDCFLNPPPPQGGTDRNNEHAKRAGRRVAPAGRAEAA